MSGDVMVGPLRQYPPETLHPKQRRQGYRYATLWGDPEALQEIADRIEVPAQAARCLEETNARCYMLTADRAAEAERAGARREEDDPPIWGIPRPPRA